MSLTLFFYAKTKIFKFSSNFLLIKFGGYKNKLYLCIAFGNHP
jgi:hypothetical protein